MEAITADPIHGAKSQRVCTSIVSPMRTIVRCPCGRAGGVSSSSEEVSSATAPASPSRSGVPTCAKGPG